MHTIIDFFRGMFVPTVDGAIAGLKKAVAGLEAAIDHHDAAADKSEEAAKALLMARDFHAAEVAKAEAIHAKLTDLIGG